MSQRCLAILITLLCTGAVLADGIYVSQSLSGTDIPFEETVKLEIELNWSGGQGAYLIDGPLRLGLDRLKVERFSSTISSAGLGTDEITTKKYEYELRPTISGLGRIEPLEISYVSWPDSIPGSIMTEALEVSIADPVRKSDSAEKNVQVGFIVGLISVFLIGLIGLLVYLRSKAQGPSDPVRTPRQSFLDELELISKNSGSDLKVFQTELYKALVQYLSHRFKVDLRNKSCDDVVSWLTETSLSVGDRESIADWLARAEREKYSPAASAPGETTRLFSEIKTVFEKMND